MEVEVHKCNLTVNTFNNFKVEKKDSTLGCCEDGETEFSFIFFQVGNLIEQKFVIAFKFIDAIMAFGEY